MSSHVQEPGQGDVELIDGSRPLESPDRVTRRRVLLVTYTFPPVGGAGVQRVTKFAKYLPACGWDVSVLTVANPSVPLQDESLCQDIPAETQVLRARTWEPGYGVKAAVVSHSSASRPGPGQRLRRLLSRSVKLAVNTLLQPDPQVLWRPGAVAVGRRALADRPFDAIVASGPPFSSFLLAASLARRSGLPLVLDYRDEWDLSNQYWENKRLGPWSLAVQQRMQRSVLRQAAAVVATTEASVANLRELSVRAGSRADVLCVYNGFDTDDFAAANTSESRAVPSASAPFRLTYVGTLWALTTLRPVADAVRRVVREDAGLQAKLRLVVAGRRTESEQAIVDSLQHETGVVEEYGYLSHTEAVGRMEEASELLVLLSDLPGVGRVLPAKVFEYLATGRPILAVAPRGELWTVLERFSHVRLFEPSQVEEMASYLAARLRGEIPLPADVRQQVMSSGYDRQTQTARLAGLLDQLAVK